LSPSPTRIPVVENSDEWGERFEAGWLAYVKENVVGVPDASPDWDLYKGARNRQWVSGKGIDVSKSRVLLVSSAGGSLVSANAPFDAENPISDPTIRVFPSSTPLDEVRFDATHYDHAGINVDPQVQLPLRHMEDLAADGTIGELTDNVVNFSGYQPDIRIVANEVAPRILDAAREEKADAALLVPA
jgi:D-proline reductase (dithiol) PrdB